MLLSEIRLAWRRLRRAPGYSAAVIVNLTLGIGAATALFAVLDAIVLQPLPYPQPDRLVVIEHEMPGIPIQGEPTRFGGFQGQVLHYGARSRLLEEIGAFEPYDAAISDEHGAEYVSAMHATAGVFRALGARAEHGRLLRDVEPATQLPGRGAVLLGQEIWSRRYGADSNAVGQTARVDGTDAEIVGIAAASGPFPTRAVSVWTPRTETQIRDTPQLLVSGFVARMVTGTDIATLRNELDGLIADLPDVYDDAFIRRTVREGRLRTRITPLTEHVVGAIGNSLLLLMAAGTLVLLAAVANVTGLRLLRREAQAHELAVRRALGARQPDLMRQHLAEAALLTSISLLASLALARAGIAALLRVGPDDLPRAAELALTTPAILLAMALAAVCAAWLAAVGVVLRPPTEHVLRSANAGASGKRARTRIRSLAVAAQLSIAVVLLVGAGLIVASFTELSRVDPGFTAERLLTFRVPFPMQEIQEAGGRGRATPFYDQLAERLGATSGIESVGYGACSPLSTTCGLQGLTLVPAGATAEARQEQRLFGILQVAGGYLETLSVPLISGRHLRRADHEDGTNAVVVSASVAAALWPTQNALGRQLMTPDIPDWSPFTVVGVVGDAHHTSLRVAAEPVVYIPVLTREQQFELSTVTFVVRTAAAPLSQVSAVRAIIADLRTDVPLANIDTVDAAIRRSTARLRLAIALLTAAAVATLGLGATGVYALIAAAVSLRRREFGIRLALGATAADLRRLVLRQGVALASLGLTAGLVAAALGGRLLEAILFGIEPTDLRTYVAVAALLGATAMVACYLPARRAARTDPAEVLRD